MPWKTVTPMDEIARFVLLARTARFTLTDLCEQFGISRKTGYKHLERFAADGMKGLQPRSHRPHTFPQRTDEAVEALVLAERRLHRTWGPKKLQLGAGGEARDRVAAGAQHDRGDPAPARVECAAAPAAGGVSSAVDHGLTEPTQPNHVWTVDFKGWFILGDGQRCDPLTVTDLYSHFVLGLKAQPNQQFKGTLRSFRGLMRQAGCRRSSGSITARRLLPARWGGSPV